MGKKWKVLAMMGVIAAAGLPVMAAPSNAQDSAKTVTQAEKAQARLDIETIRTAARMYAGRFTADQMASLGNDPQAKLARDIQEYRNRQYDNVRKILAEIDKTANDMTIVSLAEKLKAAQKIAESNTLVYSTTKTMDLLNGITPSNKISVVFDNPNENILTPQEQSQIDGFVAQLLGASRGRGAKIVVTGAWSHQISLVKNRVVQDVEGTNFSVEAVKSMEVPGAAVRITIENNE